MHARCVTDRNERKKNGITCFQELSQTLRDDKTLSEHLKLPIQRINDYQLLLKVKLLEKSFSLLARRYVLAGERGEMVNTSSVDLNRKYISRVL